MKRLSVILSCVGFAALVLVIDAVTTHIFSNLQGFEASTSIAVLFWIGIFITTLAAICGALHLLLKKEAPWKSGAFVWSVVVFVGYGLVWFFPPRGL